MQPVEQTPYHITSGDGYDSEDQADLEVLADADFDAIPREYDDLSGQRDEVSNNDVYPCFEQRLKSGLHRSEIVRWERECGECCRA